jgi:hypothetical protein
MDLCQDITDSQSFCACGRAFFKPGALNFHMRSCSKTKKRLASALSVAKELWASKKRRRVASVEQGDDSLSSAIETDDTGTTSNPVDRSASLFDVEVCPHV